MEQEPHTGRQPQQPEEESFLVLGEDGESAVVVHEQQLEDGVLVGTDVIGREGIPVQAFIGETDDPEVQTRIIAQLAQRALGVRDTDYED